MQKHNIKKYPQKTKIPKNRQGRLEATLTETAIYNHLPFEPFGLLNALRCFCFEFVLVIL